MRTKEWRLSHKDDMRRYCREWYQRNRKKVIDKGKERRKNTKEWLRGLKGSLKCERCPQTHIACLQFHHTDPKKKDMNISAAAHGGWSKERILKEMAKCQILCANCHSILHWEE
jgi:hypothetical protein